MIIKNILKLTADKLKNAKINSAHLDAEILLSFILRKPREWLLARPEKNITDRQAEKFNALIKQRARYVPIAYLTKEKEFYGRKFYVDERVLIPRPETEMIIEELRIRNYELGINTTIVDAGTGSGCIIITLAKELQKYKNLQFFATDISKDALAVARKNAKLHGVDKKIKILQGNLLEPIRKIQTANYKLIITTNLPYLTPAEIKNSPSIKYEPKLALAAGKDGLKYYRELAKQLKQLHKKQPELPMMVICEIGATQGKAMKKIFSFAESVEIKKDLAGLDRIVVIEIGCLKNENS